jgi:hypothetical protein
MASMVFGVLAFGTAFLSYLAASASVSEHYKVRREDYGGYALGAYLMAVAITLVPAFGCVGAGFIALVRGERSRQLLLPALVWLGPVLLFGLLVLMFVVGRLA